jgi:plasmid maintenance system killer protein
MILLPVHPEILEYVTYRRLLRTFQKQCRLFIANSNHPGLHTEVLEPAHLKIHSFRVNKKYRAIFIYRGPDVVEILDVNNHYQ